MDWAAAGASMFNNTANLAFSAYQSNKERAHQTRMSNTQYQRSAKDLEAAGLNRVLALGGPAGSVGNSQASSPSSSDPAISGTQAFSAKQQALKIAEEVETQKDTQDLIEAQTTKTKEEARLTSIEADKQEIIKAGYDLGKPVVDKLKESIKSKASSATDYIDADNTIERRKKAETFHEKMKRRHNERRK